MAIAQTCRASGDLERLAGRSPAQSDAHLPRAGRPSHRSTGRNEQGGTLVPTITERPSGGARAGRSEGTSVGSFRCRRIRPMTVASSMSAISRSRPHTDRRQNVKSKRACHHGRPCRTKGPARWGLSPPGTAQTHPRHPASPSLAAHAMPSRFVTRETVGEPQIQSRTSGNRGRTGTGAPQPEC